MPEVNSGIAAGQTIFHTHIHLIPRRDRDMADPRGGVRGVIPGMMGYYKSLKCEVKAR
jgi:ATP adenylyltransferase